MGDLASAQAAPLSDAGLTSYHAIAGIRPTLGDSEEAGTSVAVIGVGGLGHLAVQILRATTASQVLAVDVREEALALAAECGALFGTLVRPDTAEVLRSRTGGAGVDAVLDFVGTPETLRLAVCAVRPGGALAVVGSGGGELLVRKPGVLPPGLRISLPFWGTRRDLEQVMALARAGAVTVTTQRFPLSRTFDAIEALRSGEVRGRAVLIPGEGF